MDASVWGEYSRELDKEIIVAIFNKLEIVKEIGNRKVELTRGHLEKLQRFKNVDEVAKRWLEEG